MIDVSWRFPVDRIWEMCATLCAQVFYPIRGRQLEQLSQQMVMISKASMHHASLKTDFPEPIHSTDTSSISQRLNSTFID
jgi:hypothetical protein